MTNVQFLSSRVWLGTWPPCCRCPPMACITRCISRLLVVWNPQCWPEWQSRNENWPLPWWLKSAILPKLIETSCVPSGAVVSVWLWCSESVKWTAFRRRAWAWARNGLGGCWAGGADAAGWAEANAFCARSRSSLLPSIFGSAFGYFARRCSKFSYLLLNVVGASRSGFGKSTCVVPTSFLQKFL